MITSPVPLVCGVVKSPDFVLDIGDDGPEAVNYPDEDAMTLGRTDAKTKKELDTLTTWRVEKTLKIVDKESKQVSKVAPMKQDAKVTSKKDEEAAKTSGVMTDRTRRGHGVTFKTKAKRRIATKKDDKVLQRLERTASRRTSSGATPRRSSTRWTRGQRRPGTSRWS